MAIYEENVGNSLTLSSIVSTNGTIYNLLATNQLVLSQELDNDCIRNISVTNTLNLHQYPFFINLPIKKYILLQAPFELVQTTVVLPNPILNDNENLILNLTIRRSMTNVKYTYVKTSQNRKLKYTFTLDRMKSLELQEFINSYNGANIKMLNWKGELWRVKLLTNPVDFVQTGRYSPNSDRTDVNLEFEGVLLNG